MRRRPCCCGCDGPKQRTHNKSSNSIEKDGVTILSLVNLVALKRACWLGCWWWDTAYLELVYLVTALVPSETACLASSPGSRSLTAVWISREVMVDLLL